MSETLLQAPESSTIAGSRVIARIRRMLVVTTLIAVAYLMLVGGSKGQCFGGLGGDGGFVDLAGNPTDRVPQCVSLTLGPNPIMVLLMLAAVVWAIGRVLRSHQTEERALALLDRVQLVIGIVTVASIGIAAAWFWLGVPLDSLRGDSFFLLSPFPFGIVDVQREAMSPAG